MIAQRVAHRSATRSFGRQWTGQARLLTSSASLFNKYPLQPTNESRTSPKEATTPSHPGYTSADTPVTSDHPSLMPGVSGVKPARETPQASTRPHPPHEGVREMAEGAKIGGEDSVVPEERNVKNWAMNQRMPEFNPTEGKRNPVLDGGSNEGGQDKAGKSKT